MKRIFWILFFIVLIGSVIYFLKDFIGLSDNPENKLIPISSGVSAVPTKVPAKLTIIAGGDVMLGRTVMKTSHDLNDYSYPFRKVADILQPADLVFVNLENPIITGCKIHLGGFTFCADPKMIEGLTYAGINVVTLANNHSSNYGREGLTETVNLLKQNNIAAVGLGNYVVKEVNGVKIGFVGFDYFSNEATASDFALIKQAKSASDILIVGVHWGDEYHDTANNLQKDLAKRIVDAGADIVIGSHPHWVQNMEYINGKPIYYSLGNLVFDQMWSEETKKGELVKFTLEDKKIVKEETLSTFISSIGQPQIVQ